MTAFDTGITFATIINGPQGKNKLLKHYSATTIYYLVTMMKFEKANALNLLQISTSLAHE